MNLTPHFTLRELTVSAAAARNNWVNSPNELELENLKRLAALLEQVKTALGGAPIMISSGFRNKKVNDAIGGKDSSQHLTGCAADFRVPGMTPDQVVKAIIASGIAYDQLIREYDRWTHISVPRAVGTPPRKHALIIDSSGPRAYA